MPRPKNPIVIVPIHEILPRDYIRKEQWTLMTLLPKIQSKLQCIQWLAQHRLLQNEAVCEKCNQPATLNSYAQTVDGYRWKCSPCNWTKSIKSESWFSKSHISLQKLVHMTYFWSIDTPQNIVVRELKLQEKTVIDWFNFHRALCCEWVDNHSDPIGGLDDNQENTIVEIDESCFFRRKHHVGSNGPHQWVFGGVQRGTQKCFLVPVADRTRATLDPLIEQYIRPGTRIISDGWQAYNHIDQLGGGIYKHDVVIQQQNFVDPYDQGIHMQSVESLLKRAQRKLRNQSGTTQALFPSYIKEFMWRENACKSENLEVFSGFIKLISDIFRRRKRATVLDDSDSSEGSNSSERASGDLEKICDSDSSEADSSEGSNSSEQASGDLEKLYDSDSSEADSSEGSNSSERASDDLQKISKAKKRRKINGNGAKNGDWMDGISDGKVKKCMKENKFPSDMLELEKICLVCGPGEKIAAKHPLFTGGLCKEHMLLCHEKFFEYDSDGYNSSCCICSMGTSLVVCVKLDCGKCYCRDCLTRFIDSGVYNNATNSKNWMCNFCKDSKEGFLRKRAGWQDEIQRLYKNTDPQFPPFPVLPTVPEHERRPIRVLSLFDGISTGAVALKQLGIEIEKFVASEIDEDAVRLVKNKHPEVIHIGDITRLSDEEIYDMGPFDLVLGGSPCNDLSRGNPKRKGLLDADGSGCLFFDYYRILRIVEPPRTNDLCSERSFFWLFEKVASMKEKEKQRISRFLQCEPRMADARYVSAACRSRLFWGNLPGLMDKELTPGVNDRLTVQECLESGREARVVKLNTITSKYSSLYQGPQNHAPVVHDGEEDELWTTEVERVFGVPEHYTDVNNLGPRERVALLGRSWSVPVLRQLLSPLRDYFKC